MENQEGKKEGKGFNFDGQKVFLTYKTHLEKDETIKELENRTKRMFTFARCAWEHGKEKEYDHTHILIDMGKRFQSKRSDIFDINGIHPHIKMVGTKCYWTNALKYIAKEDPDNADLKEMTACLYDQVASKGGNLENVLRMAERPCDVMGLIMLNDCLPRELPAAPPVEFEWQKEIIEIMERPREYRKIHWIWDEAGNSGKTALLKNLYINDPKGIYIANNLGGMKDFATVIEGAIKNGWTCKGILLNLGRDHEHKSIYEPLEALKDGLMTSIKYRGQLNIFESPHVVVMANFPPAVERLSPDRWHIGQIGPALNIKWAGLESSAAAAAAPASPELGLTPDD